jgi:dihydrofolate synthase/folylpolyglutamate synthase
MLPTFREGLGGRLDATNVINNPAISIVTSIGLEHTRILGNTIELIAREKGGIFKKNCPVLVGKNCPNDVLLEVAREKGAGPYYEVNLTELNIQGFNETARPKNILFRDGAEAPYVFTDYDIENRKIAKAALRLLGVLRPDMFGNHTEAAEINELVSIRPPCRFEYFEIDDTTIILDIAHNPDAMRHLVRKLQVTFPKKTFRFVVGMSSDKDLRQCAKALLSVTEGSNIHLVEAAHPRAAKIEAIINADSVLKNKAYYDFDDRSIYKQVNYALDRAKENFGEVLVICGSVFLMVEAREAIGVDEPRDSDYISEMAGAGFRHAQENFGNDKVKM